MKHKKTMKKLTLSILIVAGLTLGVMAQPSGGGLFQRGDEAYETSGNRNSNAPMLPSQHGSNNDQNASPLGSGIAVLVGLGAAYMIGKKRKEE